MNFYSQYGAYFRHTKHLSVPEVEVHLGSFNLNVTYAVRVSVKTGRASLLQNHYDCFTVIVPRPGRVGAGNRVKPNDCSGS